MSGPFHCTDIIHGDHFHTEANRLIPVVHCTVNTVHKLSLFDPLVLLSSLAISPTTYTRVPRPHTSVSSFPPPARTATNAHPHPQITSLALKLVPSTSSSASSAWPDWILSSVTSLSGRGAPPEHILDFLEIVAQEMSGAEMLAGHKCVLGLFLVFSSFFFVFSSSRCRFLPFPPAFRFGLPWLLISTFLICICTWP